MPIPGHPPTAALDTGSLGIDVQEIPVEAESAALLLVAWGPQNQSHTCREAWVPVADHTCADVHADVDNTQMAPLTAHCLSSAVHSSAMTQQAHAYATSEACCAPTNEAAAR